ncbi:MAG: arginine--tRNA ligase [Clostridia bacterium]|nr:arginine--tRNA ligase [Clostridia bacterium]
MNNPYKNIKDKLIGKIEKAYLTACENGELNKEEYDEITLDMPKEKAHGDFATTFCMKMAKKLGKNPRETAEIIIKNIDRGDVISDIAVAGPGFINFTLDKKWLHDAICYALSNKDTYGMVDIGNKKKVMVEFISANPTGPMHIGNARGGALGDCLANVLNFAGYDCHKEFYVNDAGNQIEKFGLSLNCRFIQAVHGEDAIEFPEDAYHGDDIKESVNAFIELYGAEKYDAMEEGERKKHLVDFALKRNIEKLQQDTGRYGINYDKWFFESELHKNGDVMKVIEILKEKGYTYEQDNATWFKATEFGSEKDVVLIRGNSIPTYFAADIAYHKNKIERGFETLINIWGADHHGHVARMKGALDALGLNGDRLDIILMQLVRLYKNGEVYRVSKRSGKAVTLSDLLDETGTDAARFFFNLRQANTHFDFDLDLAVSKSNDNPVFYVQYAHARICSILNILKNEGIDTETMDENVLKRLECAEEIELMEKIAHFPEEITLSALSYDPSKITKYTVELASAFHSFYNACHVKVDDAELQMARIMLISACMVTLKNACKVLGITAPEKM